MDDEAEARRRCIQPDTIVAKVLTQVSKWSDECGSAYAIEHELLLRRAGPLLSLAAVADVAAQRFDVPVSLINALPLAFLLFYPGTANVGGNSWAVRPALAADGPRAARTLTITVAMMARLPCVSTADRSTHSRYRGRPACGQQQVGHARRADAVVAGVHGVRRRARRRPAAAAPAARGVRAHAGRHAVRRLLRGDPEQLGCRVRRCACRVRCKKSMCHPSTSSSILTPRFPSLAGPPAGQAPGSRLPSASWPPPPGACRRRLASCCSARSRRYSSPPRRSWTASCWRSRCPARLCRSPCCCSAASARRCPRPARRQRCGPRPTTRPGRTRPAAPRPRCGAPARRARLRSCRKAHFARSRSLAPSLPSLHCVVRVI